MSWRDSQTLRPFLSLGVIAGMRSMIPLAVVSRSLRDQTRPNQPWAVQQFGSHKAATILAVFVLGELLGDKLPMTPARTSDPALLGRIFSGSATGALLGAAHKQPVLIGALWGGALATVSTYSTYYIRRFLGPLLGMPDPVIGLLEDGVALAGGIWALQALDAVQVDEHYSSDR